MSELEALPEGWELVCFGDILLKIVGGGTPSKNVFSYYQGNIPWFSVKDMKSLRPRDSLQHITQEAIAESATNLIPANTVAIATRIALGKAIKPSVDYTINQDLKALILPAGLHSDFILYWFLSNEKKIYDLGSGTTVKGITLETLNNLSFKLPPEKEQTRIVEKLEELLSDLDNGVAELKAAQIKLTQYRQSLLKSAVEGSLTAEWRSKNQPSETGQQLLQRILTERRQRWEQQKRDEFKQKNQKPPKDWQLNYPEPVKPDVSELPELPVGWVWASLDMLGDIASGVTKGTKRKTPVEVFETPYLRVANVQRGYLDLSEIKTIPATQSEIENYTLKKGDILFNEGGDRDKLGRGWVWYGEVEKCIHQNHVFRLRLYVPEVIPELISHYGNTFGKLWFQNAGKQTTNLASINKGILQSFPVPLSPIVEQALIMDLLTAEVDKIDRQILAVDVGLKETDAQRKNILKEAFSGKLVPQDPSDEPASVLLEKIKAERKALAKQPKPKQTKKKANKKANLMDTLFEVLKANGDWMDAQEAFRACGVTDGGDFSDIVDKVESLYAELRRLEKEENLIDIRRVGNYDQLKLRSGSGS